MKSLFEQMGGTYHEENGYLIPNLTLPDEEQVEIGVWGQQHLRYIKQHHKPYLPPVSALLLSAWILAEKHGLQTYKSLSQRGLKETRRDFRAGAVYGQIPYRNL